MGSAACYGVMEYRAFAFLKTMSRKAHIIAGLIIGICFITLGVTTGAPKELYGLEGNQVYMMFPIGIASHTFIWGVIVYWVNGKLGVRS